MYIDEELKKLKDEQSRQTRAEKRSREIYEEMYGTPFALNEHHNEDWFYESHLLDFMDIITSFGTINGAYLEAFNKEVVVINIPYIYGGGTMAVPHRMIIQRKNIIACGEHLDKEELGSKLWRQRDPETLNGNGL